MEKVSKEIAEQDFRRFAEFARLDEERPRDESDRADFHTSVARFKYYIQRGVISVDDDGHATVHTENDLLPEIVFNNRPRVTALRSMDSQKSGNAKMLAMIGATLDIPPVKLNTLDYADFEIVSLVFDMFLG